DPWQLTYKGELHLLRGELDQADGNFSAALAQSKSQDAWHWTARNGLLRVRIKLGKAVVIYQEFGGDLRAFQDVAHQCTQEKNAAQLEALVAVHRKAQPDAADWPVWDLDVLWLKKDYAAVIKLLSDPRHEVFKLQQHKWKCESYLVRSLIKVKQLDEAVKKAEEFTKPKHGNHVLVVLVHAARGDVKKTIDAVAKRGQQRFLVEDCYRDEDLGPILRSAAFGEFRARFPEPKIPGDLGFGD
ncbi:MAG TPA: hypothetical protein VE988_05655, partial [Gemmataceae bacterium]|nr:hypothetical protein [Gemmataceae bacterium]